MPVFMFEKIAPPVHAAHVSAMPINQPRGVIVQMLDKLTVSRLEREAKALRKARASLTFTEADIIKPT